MSAEPDLGSSSARLIQGSSVARFIPGTAASLVALALLIGCSEDSKAREEIFVDEGAVCVQVRGPDTVRIAVQLPTCLSSSCDTLLDEQCSIEEKDGQLLVRSRWVVESRSGTCTLDCGGSICAADISGLAEEHYEIVYGEERLQVELSTDEDYLVNGDQDWFLDCDAN